MATPMPARTLSSAAACLRCKSKKIKCDQRPEFCSNCVQAKAECTTVDAFSGRVFPRAYPQKLEARVKYLRSFIENPELREGGLQPAEVRLASLAGGPSNGSSPADQRHVSMDDGSIPSLGQKVAAEVSDESLSLRQIDQLYSAISKEQSDVERARFTRAVLPSFADANLLVDSYLGGVHYMHPFLKRSEVYERLYRLYAISPEDDQASEVDTFQINMVFAIGAVALNRRGTHQVPATSYYLAAADHFGTAFGVTQDVHIQNVLLLLIFNSHHHVSIGNRWDFARFAMQICIEKGYHLATRDPANPMLDQMRRRMFWSAYVSDRYSSSFLGRPILIPDSEITVELPLDLNDAEIENRTLVPGPPGCKSEVSILLRQVRIRQITSAACSDLYAVNLHQDFSIKEDIVLRLIARLEHWYATSPKFTHPTTQYELPAYHELQYHRERMTIIRCLAHIQSSEAGPKTEKYLRYCLEDALRVVESYLSLTDSDSVVMHWTCVNDIMLTGFMILYTSLRITRCSGPGESKNDVIVSGRVKEATEGCLQILRHIAEKWPIIKYHLHLLEKLISAVTISGQGDTGAAVEGGEDEGQEDIQMPDMPLAVMSYDLMEGPDSESGLLSASSTELEGLLADPSFLDYSIGGELGVSDDELQHLFTNGFQDLQWDWSVMSSSLGTGLP